MHYSTNRKQLLRCNLLLCFFVVTYILTKAQTQKLSLNNHWQFKQANTSKWFTANVPGTIHTDLLANKLIDDPFYRDNENKLQWISKTDWEYKTVFYLTEKQLNNQSVELLFEGLDTYAEVYLNNTHILSANNMFRTWHIDVKQLLKLHQNDLHIIFKSADNVADSLAKNSSLIYPCENNRNYCRKAQYNFGWDFAPKLTTCGIWKNVWLIANSSKKNQSNQEKLVQKISTNTINLIQQKDSIGQSFYFTKNNQPIFITGANWVPADVFLPRVTKAKYRSLLLAAKEAHINMLRVWGGGIYEDEAFYNLCDSLNIMVWQDFMFAGAMYPTDSAFLQNITQEAIDNLKRLSRHKCIVLWCGNNEIDEAWKNWGWQKQFNLSTVDSIKIWDGYNKWFHELLPALVKQYSNQPYIASSPLIGWGRKESMTIGDSHYWGVWWGLESIEKYKEKVPRFVTEYGMQSLPNFETIQQFCLPTDLDTTSAVMKSHQKNAAGYYNLAVYLKQNNLTAKNFKQCINATQQLQSKALEVAATAHIAAKPYCMGTMFWQLNDCWPGVTWSVIDYYGRKKKAYYSIKKIYSKAL